jgi:hypothetical protein
MSSHAISCCAHYILIYGTSLPTITNVFYQWTTCDNPLLFRNACDHPSKSLEICRRWIVLTLHVSMNSLFKWRFNKMFSLFPGDVAFVPRQTNEDRIDRINWKPTTLKNFNDAHLLLDAFKPDVWPQLRKLLHLMYNERLLSWCDRYFQVFHRLLLRSNSDFRSS